MPAIFRRLSYRRCRGKGHFQSRHPKPEECNETSRAKKRQLTGCGHRAHGCCRPGGGLCGAARGVCADLPGSTRLPAAGLYLPASNCLSVPAPGGRGASGTGRAVNSRFGSGLSSACACPCASRSRQCGHCGSTTPCAAGRGHACGPRPWICVGPWLLGLEWRLGMDRRRLGNPAISRRNLGGWTLGAAGKRVCLGRRALAVGARPTRQIRACQISPGHGRCRPGSGSRPGTRDGRGRRERD